VGRPDDWFYLRTSLDPSAFEGLRPAVARAFDGAQLRLRPHPPWVVLEVVRTTPLRLFALADVWAHVAASSPFTALLGVSKDDTPVYLTLDYPDNASLLVSGGSESGKSNLLRLLVLSAALSTSPRELRMALLHGPRGDALHVVRAFPHVWHMTARPALPMLAERLRARPLRGRPPLVLVVLDDVDDLLVRSGVRGEEALHWLARWRICLPPCATCPVCIWWLRQQGCNWSKRARRCPRTYKGHILPCDMPA